MPRHLAALAGALILALLAAGCGSDDDEVGRTPQLILEEADGGEEPTGEEPPPTFPSTATGNTVRVAGRDSIESAAGVASALFPATGDSTRPDAVALVDSRNWQGGVAGSVLASEEIGAPILLTEGEELPAVTAGTLARLDPAGADSADDAQVIRIGDDVARPDDLRSTTVSGADPFELAADIDRLSAAAAGEPSDDVAVASAEEPAFAMPAAAWAARSGDSVLFTEPDALPEATRAAIEEHEEPDVYVLGPESVVSERVVRELEDVADEVERVAGDTPVESAIEFARYQADDFGWGLATPGHNFALVSSSRPLDAAAAAPLATNGVFAPLLLTNDPVELPAELRGYFLDVQPGFEDNPNEGVFNRVWILGDQEAVSLAAQARIDELLELVPVQPAEDEPPDPGPGGAPPPDTGIDPPDDAEPEDRSDDGGGGGVGPGPIPAPQGPGIPQ